MCHSSLPSLQSSVLTTEPAAHWHTDGCWQRLIFYIYTVELHRQQFVWHKIPEALTQHQCSDVWDQEKEETGLTHFDGKSTCWAVGLFPVLKAGQTFTLTKVCVVLSLSLSLSCVLSLPTPSSQFMFNIKSRKETELTERVFQSYQGLITCSRSAHSDETVKFEPARNWKATDIKWRQCLVLVSDPRQIRSGDSL